MTTRLPVLCLACSRRLGGGGCSSFPGGIPAAIAVYGADHRVSRGGEQPFEQAAGADAEQAFADWLAFHNG